jgi:hypothetical protein
MLAPARRALAGLLLLAPAGASGQPLLSSGALLDTVVTWETYTAPRHARVRLYAADDERRPRTVVVDDPAENGGLVTDEVRFFAETAGRLLRFDPAGATFVFRYTAGSFAPGADEGGRVLLLRATFTRADSGDLGTPSWRVITREALEELTDRQLR